MTYQTQKPETLVVTRDGEIDDQYYDTVYAERRQEALCAAGREAVKLVTTPVRNFSLNILDLLREHTLQAK